MARKNFDNESALESPDQIRKFRLKRMRKWRLIIRNLPFSCSTDDVRERFSDFGLIEEIVVPPAKKDPSRIAGFAFVQFRDHESAQEAMKNVNEKEIKGRPVAVDWAVPKDQYMTAVMEEKQRDKRDESPKRKKRSKIDHDDQSAKRSKVSPGDHSGEKRSKIDDQSAKKRIKAEPDYQSISDSISDREDDDTSLSPAASSKKPGRQQGNEQSSKQPIDDGVDEGRTIFIRNIPFDVGQDELQETFEHFGRLRYCVICKYPGTDHSKGSGFVQFIEREVADKCLERGQDQSSGGIIIHGQKLELCVAVSKESAKKLEKAKHDRQPKDKRNLHLLRVGLIRAGTAAAAGVSDADMAKRMRIEAANREKIKNFNIFVSPTRVCIHNLPTRIDDKQLKKICLKSVDDKTATIKECRVMRDLDRPNVNGVGKSRGYAFVEFKEHSHALVCLNTLNNNPSTFSNDKRPIVEFSLENRKALLAKEQRAEKAKLKALEQPTPGAATVERPERKHSVLKKLHGGRKFVTPTVPSSSGGQSKGKAKAFPSHFGPKIRHRKRATPESNKGTKRSGKEWKRKR